MQVLLGEMGGVLPAPGRLKVSPYMDTPVTHSPRWQLPLYNAHLPELPEHLLRKGRTVFLMDLQMGPLHCAQSLLFQAGGLPIRL